MGAAASFFGYPLQPLADRSAWVWASPATSARAALCVLRIEPAPRARLDPSGFDR
jgi:hypothetical protein